ncbi:MAG: TrbI/VirB10 family protein [Acidobacteria bacterium]|nr:TrbI/VirB10 family protein [Acidobacteriota bacterium]
MEDERTGKPSREEIEAILETTVHEYKPEPEKKKARITPVQTFALVGVFVLVAFLVALAAGAFRGSGAEANADFDLQKKEAAKAEAKAAAKEKSIKDAVLGGQPGATPETEADRAWAAAQAEAKAGQAGEEGKYSEYMKTLAEQDQAGEAGYPPSADSPPSAAERYWREKEARASRQESDPRSVYHVRGDNPAEEKQRLEKAREEYDKEKTPMFVYQRESAAKGAGGTTTAGRSRIRMQEPMMEELPPEAGAPPLNEDDPGAYIRQGRELAARDAYRPGVGASKVERRGDEKRQTTLFYTRHDPVTMFEGDFLECVLLHRIVSDTEESPVLAVVVRDLVDNSGKWVIIPQGTKVVGKTKIVDYTGAHRMYILFHRMILPDGVSVEFPYNVNALKALDQTGALGVSSKVNRHWMLQFGTALMFGLLDGLGAAATAQTESKTGAYIVDKTDQNMDKVLDTILRRYQNVVPTVTVNQGFRMRVYITDDVAVTPYCKVRDRAYAKK